MDARPCVRTTSAEDGKLGTRRKRGDFHLALTACFGDDMRARLWLLLPAVCLYLGDLSLTLAGQPEAYWAGDYAAAAEYNPIAYPLLAQHPAVFGGGALGWLAVFTTIVLRWREQLVRAPRHNGLAARGGVERRGVPVAPVLAPRDRRDEVTDRTIRKHLHPGERCPRGVRVYALPNQPLHAAHFIVVTPNQPNTHSHLLARRVLF